MDAIRHMLAPVSSVLRQDKRRALPAEELVPGDLVYLEAGDKVPADLRLIYVNGLMVQEALLTGESVPVEKDTAPVPADAVVGDRFNLAFSGTLVTSGQARGIVVGTGRHTEIGRIGSLIADVQTLNTPLVTQMTVFAKWLTALILLLAGTLLMFGYFVQGQAFDDLFMVVVSLAVAAIPEGLPAVLTIALAIGVQAMARRNAIIRRLPSIEALGSVSVICTDKTGTLTLNEMMVAHIATTGSSYLVTGTGYVPEGDIRHGDQPTDPLVQPDLAELVQAGALCNDASLHEREAEWRVHGDPMEGALLVLAGKAGLDAAVQRDWHRTDAIPFDSSNRFMATLHHTHQGGARIAVKGAPEKLLSMCRVQRLDDGGTAPLDPDLWHARADEIAASGQRVIALAARPVNHDHTVLDYQDLEQDLIFLGLVGLIDPPREEAISAVAECHSAGIRVKMITGDHARTAAAIARQIGLDNPDDVLTGAELEIMDDTALADAAQRIDVFARTSPEHKLRLVMALQSRHEVVAMTGDGVNDAPALKRADAGIAMGMKGSEAAKEAAELVLADDNFATIVSAVREGRTVYDNLIKVISWTLPTNAGEAAIITAALLFGLMLPVTPVQILWINLITASTLGIALAFEPTEDSTMQRPPRPRHQPLLSGTLLWHIILVSLLFLWGVFGIFYYALERGYSIELARTMVVNTLVVMEIFHLFFIRNIYGTSLTLKAVSGTPMVWLTVAVVTAAQFAITYLPPMQAAFDTRPVPLGDGLVIVGVGITLFAIVETEKQIRLRLRPARDDAIR